jgi:hypothetical protein
MPLLDLPSAHRRRLQILRECGAAAGGRVHHVQSAAFCNPEVLCGTSLTQRASATHALPDTSPRRSWMSEAALAASAISR